MESLNITALIDQFFTLLMLPLLSAIGWYVLNHKRDLHDLSRDLKHGFERVNKHIDRVEEVTTDHDQRIGLLEIEQAKRLGYEKGLEDGKSG